MRRLWLLASRAARFCVSVSVSVGVGMSVSACSSGIAEVAPPGDEDSGAFAGDTGGGGGDDVAADSSRDTSNASDAPPSDGGGSDGGGIDGGIPDATPADGIASDGSVKTCIVVSTGESSGCSGEEYCDAPGCVSGTCRKRSTSLPTFEPVCGCDGVSYWNDHFAHSAGRSTKSGSGECSSGPGVKTCGGLSPKLCPSSTDCVTEGSGTSTCTLTPSGLCWSFPKDADCSGVTSKKMRICGGACKPRCQAILDADTFYGDSSCP